LRLLAELDARRLYLGEGCSSLFSYCTQVLHLSEHAAYHRIEAARAARQFPVVLVAEGALTLTNVALLRAHLTADNHQQLLAAARQKTKRVVEHHAAILDRAHTQLVDHLERQKIGRPRRPRSRSKPGQTHTRYISAAVRHEVWTRDKCRCAFEGPRGRCRETGRLEFHYLQPFTEGGPATVANLSLRCRAHNGYEWTRSGPDRVDARTQGLHALARIPCQGSDLVWP
jgi:hypothetical protein